MGIIFNNQNILYVFKKGRGYQAVKSVLIEYEIPHEEIVVGKKGVKLTREMILDLVDKSENGFYDVMRNTQKVKDLITRGNTDFILDCIMRNNDLLCPIVFMGYKHFMHITLTTSSVEEYTPFMEAEKREMVTYNDREYNYGS